jgi:hypothetical protein
VLAARAGRLTAQAGGEAAEMKTWVGGVAGRAADWITAGIAGLRDQLPGKTGDLTRAMRAGGAAAGGVTPAPAQEAAARAARMARERPGRYAAAAAVLLLVGWLLWRGGRR